MTLSLLTLAGAFGLIIGSFLNVCIARLPTGESIASPPSRCPSCLTPIRWHDNIPVLSYLVLGGRCRACRARISARYPMVEATTAAAFMIQTAVVGEDPALLAARLTLTAALIVLFGTDLDTERLPNVVTLPGIAVGIAFSALAEPGLRDSIVGAALGALVLMAIRVGWKRATGIDGMGLGDVKMLAMIGAFLGWQQIFVVLFLASVSGAVVGLALARTHGRSLQARLPFGTFLAVAAFLSSVFGGDLLDWYLTRF